MLLPKESDYQKTCSILWMKFDRSNKFDLCYYGQVNLLRLNQVWIRNGQVNTFEGNIYFAGDGTWFSVIKN